MNYAWLVWGLFLIVIWIIIYILLKSKENKREMFWVSLWTSLLGLTEPFFVPKYWNPFSLFDLAHRIGFDIESLIFSFGIGGIAVVIYELIFRVSHEQIMPDERHLLHHRYHIAAILSAPVIFFFLIIFSSINPIYSAIIAMFIGGFFTLYCRPDLKKKMITSAFIFAALYFIYFLTLIVAYPDYVAQVWNLKAISGILILDVPLEEILFSLCFGFLWSSVYEHIKWYKIKLAK